MPALTRTIHLKTKRISWMCYGLRDAVREIPIYQYPNLGNAMHTNVLVFLNRKKNVNFPG